MSACPSIVCTARRSAPPASRWPAKEGRRVWGEILIRPPAPRPHFAIRFHSVWRVIGRPRRLKNSALVAFSLRNFGRPSFPYSRSAARAASATGTTRSFPPLPSTRKKPALASTFSIRSVTSSEARSPAAGPPVPPPRGAEPRGAQPRRVQEHEHRAVAHPLRRGAVRRRKETLHLGHGQVFREGAADAGAPRRGNGACREKPFALQEPEERPQRGDVPRDAARGEPLLPERREELQVVDAGKFLQGDGTAGEERREPAKVEGVRLQRVRGGPPPRPQLHEERVHEGVSGHGRQGSLPLRPAAPGTCTSPLSSSAAESRMRA